MANLNTLSFSHEFLSSMMAEALMILDFQRKNFKYIPHHDLFLCGYSQETPKRLGYNFFKKTIYPKDLPFLIGVHDAIVESFNNNELSADKINYFSFNIMVKSSFLSKKKSDYIMIYVKLKPILLEERLRYGTCLLSASVLRKTDKLIAHYNNMDLSYYSFGTKQWTNHSFSPLSKKQQEMLVWSHQGLSVKEIADKMCVAVKTIEGIRQTLFKIFGVNSVTQAVQYALNRKMIYSVQSEIR